MKWVVYNFLVLFIAASCRNNHLLKETLTLGNYPSASAIEYYRQQFYIMGDDARYLLILDSSLAVLDSITLYEIAEKRISKDRKPDLESMTILRQKNTVRLLLMGSGSLEPHRNLAWLIDPATKRRDSIRLDTFYHRLRQQGLDEVNIEGSCSIPGSLILSNRGHKGYRKNFLVFTHPSFYSNQSHVFLNLVRIGSNTDTTVFNGVSGLAYSPKSDRLVLTVSTEETRSVYDDGAIGKSYVWIVNNISSKQRWKSINPNQVIDLEELDAGFKGQKIESACVVKETKHFLQLALAADNDDGSSTLFVVWIEKS
ncbi:MAG TPA: hypothetical protein VFX58_16795 [Chitinophagaceae bacterium]|nr:hypothetical protein [Chitinophagaceae bacterium]